jgi:hypothetical protein
MRENSIGFLRGLLPALRWNNAPRCAVPNLNYGVELSFCLMTSIRHAIERENINPEELPIKITKSFLLASDSRIA